MKKLMLFLAACVALTACKKEVLTQGTPFQKGETVTITAGAGGSGGNAKVGGYDDGSSLIKFTWNEGDEIKVTVGTASSNFLLSDGAGEANAAFMGTMPASGTNFDVQYPTADPDLSTQTYVKDSVPKGKMLFTATNCTKDHIAELKMAYAILKLQFTGSETVSKIVVKTVDHTPAKSYTLNIGNLTLNTTTPTPFLMVVDPMTAKLKVTLYDNASGVITSFTTSSAQTLTAGQCLKMDEKPVVAEPQCLCFTALSNSCSVKMNNYYSTVLEYSKNGGAFTSGWNGSAISLAQGEKLYIRASSAVAAMYGARFATTGDLKVSGNIMSLLNGTNPSETIESFECFKNLFKDCTGIIDASDLLLPATTLANWCYWGMFSGCTKLTAAPELPAMTLQQECYREMFTGCTALTVAPALPATTLKDGCYYEMFNGCTSLTTAPALEATTLEPECYYGMFNSCTSLTTAPALPAQTLCRSCYAAMFVDCTNLTVVPELRASTLGDRSYMCMFMNCSKLKTIYMLATDVSGPYCLSDWLHSAGTSVSEEKKLHVASSMINNEYIELNTPSYWTIVTP